LGKDTSASAKAKGGVTGVAWGHPGHRSEEEIIFFMFF
jgi:hypothetical protein